MLRTAATCLLAACCVGEEAPTIGILGVPGSQGCDTFLERDGELGGDGGFSCFTTVYAKFLQQAGSRTVALNYNLYDDNLPLLKKLLDGLNGVLFTGGGLELLHEPLPVQKYMRTAQYIYNTSVAKHNVGTTFPVWGTCMGLQTISILGADMDPTVVEYGVFDSEDISLPVFPTKEVEGSRMFGEMPASAYDAFTKYNVTANLHHDGVVPSTYSTNKGLREFRLLATSFDRKGKEFAAMIEHRKYPIFAVQFHPERPAYEWTTGHHFNRTLGSLRANRYLSDFFIGQAYKNDQSLVDAEVTQYCESHSTNELASRVLHGTRMNFTSIFYYTD